MKAKAKINLFLHVVGKNHNNYHLLDSMVLFAEDIYDLLEIQNDEKTYFDVTGLFAESIKNNILWKLLLLLQNINNFNCKIKLVKNIPVAAGLGGGSSDVAVALKILLKLWNIELSSDQIKELCLKLGADVYCCYHQLPLYFSGVGEIIEPIKKIPQLYAVLINPLISVSTKEIFSYYSHDNFSTKLSNKPYDFNSTNEFICYISKQRNDLEPIAVKIVPEINKIINELLAQDGCLLARMSGSGATCFGLYEKMSDAIIAATKISTKYNNWWVRPTILS